MVFDEKSLQRRVAGYHDQRLDGMLDIVVRARGAAVMDIGCNRGLVGFELANNGARLVHGCDIFPEGIEVARHLFIDLRAVEAQFEVVDLTQGPKALAPFRGARYDIMLCLATVHKLKRVMPPLALAELLQHLGKRTSQYFAWRATSEKFQENEDEMHLLDRELGAVEMRRVHTSYLSRTLGVAAIWARGY
jgi:2-polyprenyl-3-methyl-5-hydroxy-6-metoxy-1,4-benzoquinol methylase